ncbi:MAG: HAD family hydrolase [Clostridia bacterium]|nr:HAD family hydrolase [Clostridia bacterium]
MDSIIFDLDGTLWDSRENICKAWNEVIAQKYPELGELTVERISEHMGKLLPDITRGLFPHLDEDTLNDVTKSCCEYENDYISRIGGILYDGVEETLEALSKRYRLFIVSNCQEGYIEAFFAAHGLQKYFCDYECNGRTGLSKADNIKLIVKRNSLTDACYVGDTKLDGKSAREAKIPFLWASYGFGDSEDFDVKLHNFTELAEIFCKNT